MARTCAAVLACMAVLVGMAQSRFEPHPLDLVGVHRVRHLRNSGVSITVNSTQLTESGQWFEVSWKGVDSPSFNDWIGLYVPANADFTTTAPAKYQMASSVSSHLFKGEGMLKFKLLNYRHDMAFAFMRGSLANATVAAVSETIHVADPNEPLQGHLTLTANPGEVMLQWVTRDTSKPRVKYGPAPGSYPYTAVGSSFTYRREDLCGPPATTVGWLDPGSQHTAVMRKLKPGQRYYYIYGDEEFGYSQEASFLAPPEVGPETTVTMLAVADLGQAEPDGSFDNYELASLNTTRLMAAEARNREYQLLVHNGDISYARGYASQWDNFFHQLHPLASRMPYMVTPGNHERDYPGTGDRFNAMTDSGGECGVSYEKRITMPLKEAGKQWYSFNFGPIHFLQYSTEVPFHPGSEQYQFVVEDLQRVDRRRTPWVIVGGHRPIYIDSTYGGKIDGDLDVGADLKQAFEALFFKFRVDMTWHGHHHSYQRTCPVYKEMCLGFDKEGTAMAPVHLVIGNAGAGLCLNVQPKQPSWIKVLKLWWGYLRLTVSGTRLDAEMISDYDGSVMDAFTLTKPKQWGEAFHRGMEQHGGRWQEAPLAEAAQRLPAGWGAGAGAVEGHQASWAADADDMGEGRLRSLWRGDWRRAGAEQQDLVAVV